MAEEDAEDVAEEDAVAVVEEEDVEAEEAEEVNTILKSLMTIELITRMEREDIRDQALMIVPLTSNLELARKTTVAKPDTRREVTMTS